MELTKDIRTILDMSISLTSEKDYHRLLEGILKTAMDITSCDAGTLYLKTEEGLKFMIMRNKTLHTYQGGDGKEVDLPLVEMSENNICAYSAIHRKTINISDVYESGLFDFTGPKKYDQITGYHTGSMLVLPLESHEGDILGVLQLINAMDKEGRVIPFEPVHEYIVYSVASQSAVSLANMKHMEDMRQLLDSMVAAFTKAIDERTPYNANHTTNVAKYTEQFIDFLNQKHAKEETPYYFDKDLKEQVVMAARLHDIGKLVIPLGVMNKAERLGEGGLERIKQKFDYLRIYMELDYQKGNISKDQFEEEMAYLDHAFELIKQANQTSFLTDEMLEQLRLIGEKSYRTKEGELLFYLTERERENLAVRRGTLTPKERVIMESHVEKTAAILNEIKFGEKYSKVKLIAQAHHEYLNGEGYPNGLKAEELPDSVRILTIMDIFDSLISTDRPYKKPMPVEKALCILKEMVQEGKLDGELVELFCEFRRSYV